PLRHQRDEGGDRHRDERRPEGPGPPDEGDAQDGGRARREGLGPPVPRGARRRQAVARQAATAGPGPVTSRAMTTALPTPPEHRQSPRELLGFLEAHVGTRRAAVLCAEVLGDDDPHDHAETVLFLGGAGGRDVLDGGQSWKPYWARVWGARGLLYVWDDSCAPVVLDRLV